MITYPNLCLNWKLWHYSQRVYKVHKVMYYVKTYVQLYFIFVCLSCSEKNNPTHGVDLRFPSEFSVYISVHNNLLMIFKFNLYRFLKSESNKYLTKYPL